MLLGEHPGETGALFSQGIVDVRRVRAADDLLEILVLLHHDDDVIIDRETRWPRDPRRRSRRKRACGLKRGLWANATPEQCEDEAQRASLHGHLLHHFYRRRTRAGISPIRQQKALEGVWKVRDASLPRPAINRRATNSAP